MIKEIKTEKFEGLAVLVPDIMTEECSFYPNALTYKVSGAMVCESLPTAYHDGKWIVLGKATELTEEQCRAIIPENKRFFNAIAPFNQLLTELGCYSVNPEPNDCHDAERFVFDKWKEAEANTGTWLILQKI